MAYNFKKIKKEFGHFIRQYHRKAQKSWDPNDRGYDRKIEEKLKRMKSEDVYNILCDSDIQEDDVLDWPFDEPENVAVFTSIHIINDGMPILHVTHDEDDGAWQFHSGEFTKTEEAKVVSLKEIYDIDRSIGELAKLPLGYKAERKSIKDKWVIHKT